VSAAVEVRALNDLERIARIVRRDSGARAALVITFHEDGSARFVSAADEGDPDAIALVDLIGDVLALKPGVEVTHDEVAMVSAGREARS